MRISPSWSTVMNEKVGSTCGLTTAMSQFIDRVDRLPVMHGGAAERVDGELELGGADRVHIDDVAQVVDIRQDEIFLVRRVAH